jgi:endonuclease/exonuclease/phosphatase family metal-dependent hydrolase
MKIIFLNAWHGQRRDALAAFLSVEKEDTDLFCFQEATGAVRGLARERLPAYDFAAGEKPIAERGAFAQAAFLRAPYIFGSEEMLLLGDPETGTAQALDVQKGEKRFLVLNVHGMPQPGHKEDTEARLRQSESLLTWLDHETRRDLPQIVGGDFNLLPDTESIRLFERAGFRNLIRDFNIKTTRNALAWSRYPGRELYHSDYVFVRNALVSRFRVPEGEISDHLPLIVELEGA